MKILPLRGPGWLVALPLWTLLSLACVSGNKGVEYHPEETTETPVTVQTGDESQVTTITLVGASGGWLLLPVALFLWSRRRTCLSALDRVMGAVEDYSHANDVRLLKDRISQAGSGGIGDPVWDDPELLIQSRLKKINGSKKKG